MARYRENEHLSLLERVTSNPMEREMVCNEICNEAEHHKNVCRLMLSVYNRNVHPVNPLR